MKFQENMPSETKTKILDAAEDLFADRGIDGVSIRSIISLAGVNLGAIHYHFGSKESLIKEVFHRRIGEVNNERLRLLNDCLINSRGNVPELRMVLRAFIAPPLCLLLQPERGHVFIKVCGRAYGEASEHLRGMFISLFREVFEKFSLAIFRALPNIPEEEIIWRFHFVVGAMIHTMLHGQALKQFRPDIKNVLNVEENIERLVQFSVSGLCGELKDNQKGNGLGTGLEEEFI